MGAPASWMTGIKFWESSSFPQLGVRLRDRGFHPRDRFLRDVHVSSFARLFAPQRARPRFSSVRAREPGLPQFCLRRGESRPNGLGQGERCVCSHIRGRCAAFQTLERFASSPVLAYPRAVCGFPNIGTFCELPRTPFFNVGVLTAAWMPAVCLTRQPPPGRTKYCSSSEWRAHRNASTLKWGVGGR